MLGIAGSFHFLIFFNGPPQRSRKHRSIPPRPPFHRTSHRSLTAWYIVTCDKANLGSMVIHDSRCPACPKDSRGTNQAISRGVSVHIYHIDGGWIHVFLICCRVATTWTFGDLGELLWSKPLLESRPGLPFKHFGNLSRPTHWMTFLFQSW